MLPSAHSFVASELGEFIGPGLDAIRVAKLLAAAKKVSTGRTINLLSFELNGLAPPISFLRFAQRADATLSGLTNADGSNICLI